MAGSVFKSAMDEQRAQRSAERRAAQNDDSQSAPVRQPQVVKPVEPIRPTQPATPPTINNPSSSNTDSSASATPEVKTPATPAVPKSVPKDESIDMVIIEDDSATY